MNLLPSMEQSLASPLPALAAELLHPPSKAPHKVIICASP